MDLIGLIPSFGNLAFTLIAFVISLTVIVFIHEMGHYLVGRWSGIKADVFSVGMGPVLASRMDRHGTRWQIAALPIGGYVKFRGDANAASAKGSSEELAAMTDSERRETMHGAPLWARASTVAAGPVFNFILSIIVFTGMAMWQGTASEPLTVGEMRIEQGGVASLLPGDEILAIAGRQTPPLAEFAEFAAELPPVSPTEYEVRRGEDIMQIEAPYPYPPFVAGISPNSAAADAGLEEGDLITSVDGAPIATFEDLRTIVGEGEGAELSLGIQRGDEALDVTLTPRRVDLPMRDGGFETRWLLGVTGGLIFEPATRPMTPVEAVGTAFGQLGYIVTASVSGLYHMVTGAISSCNLSGPIGIAETAGQAASGGVPDFIWFIAVLSAAVGLINLFPIPVLDGGHLVFHAYEAVFRRPPSDKALNVLMTIGLVLVLSLMIFGLTNDIFCP